MENLGRRDFESGWRDVFRGAEGERPSESVWLAIDGALTAAENRKNKTRVVFYQRLAASLLLLTTISLTISYWKWRETSTPEILSETTSPGVTGTDHARSNVTGEKNAGNNAHPKLAGISPLPKSEPVGQPVEGNNPNAGAAVQKESDAIVYDVVTPGSNSFDGAVAGNVDEKPKDLTPDEEKELVAKLKAQIEETVIPDKRSSSKNVWLAVGAAGGSFAPQASASGSLGSMMDQISSSSPAYSTADRSPDLKRPTVGTSFSFGIMAGKQLSRKWVLQTGLTYWKQRMDYQSNVTQLSGNVASAFSADYTPASSTQISLTAPYELSSTAEFISIPMQAGYVLVDKKIGWILNAGIATDVFLNNTLSDRSGQYKAYSQDGGESTLYRRVSWSAMTGMEVNVRLSQQYRIALVPGVRYSFTNIYNADSGTSRPLVFDIGLRFRYIFK